MPKAGVDGPSYAGHVNVNPHGGEPEWVLEQDAPAVEAVLVEAEVKPEPKAKTEPPRRTARKPR